MKDFANPDIFGGEGPPRWMCVIWTAWLKPPQQPAVTNQWLYLLLISLIVSVSPRDIQAHIVTLFLLEHHLNPKQINSYRWMEMLYYCNSDDLSTLTVAELHWSGDKPQQIWSNLTYLSFTPFTNLFPDCDCCSSKVQDRHSASRRRDAAHCHQPGAAVAGVHGKQGLKHPPVHWEGRMH